ncbi:MAG: acyl-CoA dehydrogenase family protein [Phycisphaerae bacterium]|nr:acyl-CoA dehydrogenase family protein [Phycisphaerae bacterium]
MANFFDDNKDIQFRFATMKLAEVAEMMEDGFKYAADYDYAPSDAADAIDNYRRVLSNVGELCAEFIEPRAEGVDQAGPKLNENGSVDYAPGTAENLEKLAQADLMGFTLPYQYGGLNFPSLVYTIATELISRADASLMNLFGLQGIAETIHAFASDEIKQEYLPGFADGRYTGAMVLTEPDAGSDLQAVKVRAYQDDAGQWRIQGVKRFITNGCGEILLVLARSEPEISDGRGLSLLLVERGPKVVVRRLENKLGIHGSPTCELQFNDTPAKLIGERQRGLITYVLALMNGARLGIAAQGLGLGEAAYQVARDYAHARKQFGVAIEELPAVRDMLVEMRLDLEAARALTYETAYCVDKMYGAARKLEFDKPDDKELVKTLRNQERSYKRINGMLTPMSKYIASEMCNRVAYDAIQILGGSGYMRDYPCERYLRDARIAPIYEGTSQLQVVAAVRGVMSGTASKLIDEILVSRTWPEALKPLADQLAQGRARLEEIIAFVKARPGTMYMDLYGRKIVDVAIDLLCGCLFLRDAAICDELTTRARRWIVTRMPRVSYHQQLIMSGDTSTMENFAVMAGSAGRDD